MSNAKLNLPYVQNTILDLPNGSTQAGTDSAIVIGAGPSLNRQNSIAQIKDAGYRGTLICADGALGQCLRGGLIPEYVVSIDPHPTRIGRWFGDPELVLVSDDDYFRRQDLDPHLRIDELVRNKELIEMVNEHGPGIKAIISTSVSQRVAKRCLEAGMSLYWWNPLFDDFDAPDSLTRQVYQLNKVPCMASGGNGGSAAWVFAHAILGMRQVAVVGMDFGYAPGTQLGQTQYYPEMREIFGDRAEEAYIDVRNPYLKETWFTDPAYYWYRQVFLEMAQEASCETFNCTEGGILFGKGVKFMALGKFLALQISSTQ
jgi:hypothetical protein